MKIGSQWVNTQSQPRLASADLSTPYRGQSWRSPDETAAEENRHA